jgi:hypothetical protein
MGTRKSRIGHKSLADRLLEIPEANELKRMILDRNRITDIADVLQQEWGHFCEHTRESLVRQLYAYRRKLLKEEGAGTGVDTGGNLISHRRAITKIIRKRHDKVLDSVDKMIELEALYLVQRDRLEWLLEEERKENVPYQGMARDFLAAANTLLAHLKCEAALLVPEEDEKGAIANFDRYSENTAKALANPESRRRVVSLIERIQRNVDKVSNPCDVPVSCGPEVDLDDTGEPVRILIDGK